MSKRKNEGAVVYKGGGSKMAKTKFVTEVKKDYTNVAGKASGDIGVYPAGATLGACNRAVTVSGIRWNISHATGSSSVSSHLMKWIIWIRRGNASLPTLGFAQSGESLSAAFAGVNPNDILVWGSGYAGDAGASPRLYEGATKTQRKMNEGDSLIFSWLENGGTTELGGFHGLIQTFLKS